MRQQLSINNPHPSFFQQKSVPQGVCEFFLNVGNGALAVEERGKVEDPLTIASQSRDDFNILVTPALFFYYHSGSEPESRLILIP